MKKLIFIVIILFNLNIFAEDLKTTVQEQMKFFQTNSYSCTFTVPDPLNANATINALVPMHQKHLTCTNDYVNNEASVSTDDRVSTGDSVLFSATMCRTGLIQFCDNIKNSLHADFNVDKEDGRPYRSPILKATKNYAGDSDNTFSMDHTLGVLLYLETSFNNIQKNSIMTPPEKALNIKNLQDYARKFAKYINNNRPLVSYQVCPIHSNLDNVTICSMAPFLGEIQLIQDVYTYIGITDSPFPNQVDKVYLASDVDALLGTETTGCTFKPGYLCHLSSIIYLIEKDMNFSNARNPELKNKMEGSRKFLVALSSNNPFQTYALSLPDTAPINWQDLGQETVDICKNTVDNKDWITADNRPNWLWEQSNSDIKTGPNNKTAWGWDCLGMLTLVNTNL